MINVHEIIKLNESESIVVIYALNSGNRKSQISHKYNFVINLN